ncbi:hypothetical protein [Mesorhizobium sp. Cs1299R1N3]|uniref:hypothetical protein n=1 Tax=Mesorhizobium sp. Cs1299R1N3 TaxID=3015173 RepID=UPI00301BC652
MNPSQINNAIERLKAIVGPSAYISISMTSDHGLVRGVVYPLGILSGGAIYAERCETFESAFEQLNAKWAEERSKYHVESIRKMALEVIDHTHRKGECTAADLRKKFSADEIAFFGSDALTVASEMAGGTAFFILPEPTKIAA